MLCLRALLVGSLVEDEAKLAPLFQIQECNRVLRRDLSFQAQTPQPVICFYDGSKLLRHAAARSRKGHLKCSTATSSGIWRGTRRLYVYRWLRVDEDGPAGAVITSDIAGSSTPGLLLYQRPTCKIM
ncbi:uncharacterized protein LOC119300202 [Triticum dicoccoides]|uniref:uncharacterized protein LOC119300202 n=1 Tax=Triticum dicoccoides TaxID=85692 RepID=UPI00188F6F9E|nr:uncharacterized protein LOC119300202 [Triticum dicoccoides]